MSELALIEEDKLNPVELFNGNNTDSLDKVIEEIRERVSNHVPDLSTDKGRKEVASLARKVSSCKVVLDEMGKKLTEDWRKKTDLVNASRNKMKEKLDALRDETRRPLTEWEEKQKAIEAEKERIENERKNYIQSIINGIGELSKGLDGMPSEEIKKRISQLDDIIIDENNFQEFFNNALLIYKNTESSLFNYLKNRLAFEEEQKQLELKRKENEEREQKLKEERERIEREEKEHQEQLRKEREELAEKQREFERKEEEAKKRKEEEERKQREEEDRKQKEKEQKEEEERLRKEEEERKQAEEKLKAEQAPDKEKLELFFKKISSYQLDNIPKLSTKNGKTVIKVFNDNFEILLQKFESNINQL